MQGVFQQQRDQMETLFSKNYLRLSTEDRRQLLLHSGYSVVGIQAGTKHPTGFEALEWTRKVREDPQHYVTNISPRHPYEGIVTDGLRPIDGDIDDRTRMAALHEYIQARLGDVPYRYRDGSPRKLYLFRAAEGQPSKRYVVNEATKERVECLGYGNQFFAFGIHPSGEVLKWTTSPLEIERDDLPAITEDEVSDLLAFSTQLIGATNGSQRRTIDPTERLRLPATACTGRWPVADLQAALDAIPCPSGYDDWFALSAAFYDACGGSGMGYAIWDSWCSSGPGYEPRTADALWRSLTCDAGYTAGTLVHEARQTCSDWDRLSRSGFTRLKFFNSNGSN